MPPFSPFSVGVGLLGVVEALSAQLPPKGGGRGGRPIGGGMGRKANGATSADRDNCTMHSYTSGMIMVAEEVVDELLLGLALVLCCCCAECEGDMSGSLLEEAKMAEEAAVFVVAVLGLV